MEIVTSQITEYYASFEIRKLKEHASQELEVGLVTHVDSVLCGVPTLRSYTWKEEGISALEL